VLELVDHFVNACLGRRPEAVGAEVFVRVLWIAKRNAAFGAKFAITSWTIRRQFLNSSFNSSGVQKL